MKTKITEIHIYIIEIHIYMTYQSLWTYLKQQSDKIHSLQQVFQ